MKNLFKKSVCLFSIFIFMFSGLFFQAKADIVVERDSENKINRIRYETLSDVKKLEQILKSMKRIFSCEIMKHGYDVRVTYEGIWTLMALNNIPNMSEEHDYNMSKFLASFILKDYRGYEKDLYVIRVSDIHTRILEILDYIKDSDCIEIEMLTITGQS